MVSDTDYKGEACVRCGEMGEDRRTLWHSCFYAMEELGVPFERMMVKGETFAMTGTKELRFSEDPRFPVHTVPVYSEVATGVVERGFYTLRVCKSCRSTWMRTIKDWFNTPVAPRESCGSGIYIRENGEVVEITEEEWQRRYGTTQPTRKGTL